MRRGTTPTLRVTVDADLTGMSLYLALKAGGRALVVKRNADMDIEVDGEGDDAATVITVKLSQSDTLGMKSGDKCEVQLRAVTDGGETALATNIGSLPVQRILQDGELYG